MTEEDICSRCGKNITPKNLGYINICNICSREIIMSLPDVVIADELTRDIFPHNKDCYLKEAIRRILLQQNKKKESDNSESKNI